MMSYILILGGFVALYIGGELFMSGAVSISQKLRIPPLIIGLTIASIATSTPEIMVAIRSAFEDMPDLAAGSVVGTNVVNVYLILALAALIMPIVVDRVAIRANLLFMIIASSALLVAGLLFGEIGRIAGIVFLLILAGYYIHSYYHARTFDEHPEEVIGDIRTVSTLWAALLLIAIAIVFLTAGSHWLVDGASAIAQQFGLSEAVIGLTIVAFGTSLPELTLCVIGALRGHSSLAFGNIVGSHIINILAVLGVTSIIKPIALSPLLVRYDIPLLLILTLLLALVLELRGKIGRITAVLFL
ncbi:MAG: calcium/sodium antiporter, partial [Coriobacteriia bacterium]|nr:calcium/sodium antiporter [Coriobacteriia bacterium]